MYSYTVLLSLSYLISLPDLLSAAHPHPPRSPGSISATPPACSPTTVRPHTTEIARCPLPHFHGLRVGTRAPRLAVYDPAIPPIAGPGLSLRHHPIPRPAKLCAVAVPFASAMLTSLYAPAPRSRPRRLLRSTGCTHLALRTTRTAAPPLPRPLRCGAPHAPHSCIRAIAALTPRVCRRPRRPPRLHAAASARILQTFAHPPHPSRPQLLALPIALSCSSRRSSAPNSTCLTRSKWLRHRACVPPPCSSMQRTPVCTGTR